MANIIPYMRGSSSMSRSRHRCEEAKRRPRHGGLLVLQSILLAIWGFSGRGPSAFVASHSAQPFSRLFNAYQRQMSLITRGIDMTGVPSRMHRPFGAPFAVTVKELVRRPLDFETAASSEELEMAHNLTSRDIEVRRTAAKNMMTEVKSAQNPKVMGALFNAVYDQDHEVRLLAADAIRRIAIDDYYGADPWVAKFAQKLRNNETSVIERVLTLESLGRLGQIAQFYTRCTSSSFLHEEPMVRLAAVGCIKRIGDQFDKYSDKKGDKHYRFRRSHLSKLKFDENAEVRTAANRALRTEPDKWIPTKWMENQKRQWEDHLKDRHFGRRTRNKANSKASRSH
eukprot:TRINITY_DN5365_c0_g1_i7.p1 TRINITY_DN5365_c0_g1~~TRINITY_DN5365_c0_g1_i7.p1  ORF type:complete len:352 (+),score=27.79 TRINITY_DN5365_c0_g1_i7:39-1058(+)